MNALSTNKLTVIIPFLNEGKEVYNTVKNLRESSDREFDILLINDASSDGYNYKKVANEFGTNYIEHKERMGVAASRDEGVELCSTEYFLLLDAHMRVYQHDWIDIIVSELRKDNRVLLCGRTKFLTENGEIPSNAINVCGFGAYIHFNDLSVHWIDKDLFPDESIYEIPCILGASYACSKTYWKYLKGLMGLRSYGLDEQLISIKVWLEGGKCRLLKNVTFGHIFRTLEKVPYPVGAIDFGYNKLFMVELFLDNNTELIKSIRKEYGIENFRSIVNLLAEKKNDILEEKNYYKNIFTHNIKFLYDLNNTSKFK
jgi:Glycosyltransferases involved in cell wall biogenesis